MDASIVSGRTGGLMGRERIAFGPGPPGLIPSLCFLSRRILIVML